MIHVYVSWVRWHWPWPMIHGSLVICNGICLQLFSLADIKVDNGVSLLSFLSSRMVGGWSIIILKYCNAKSYDIRHRGDLMGSLKSKSILFLISSGLATNIFTLQKSNDPKYLYYWTGFVEHQIKSQMNLTNNKQNGMSIQFSPVYVRFWPSLG